MKSENFGEQAKSQKEIEWEQKQQEADKIVDGLGLGIDSGIKEAVVSFMANDFPTDGSCEGHLAGEGEDEHGLTYPWIGVCVAEPDGWQKSEEKKQQWKIDNIKQQEKMANILEDFYKDRESLSDARLTFEYIGIFGAFRVLSTGALNMESLTKEQEKQKLELYRKEINDFAEFLKTKFMQGG